MKKKQLQQINRKIRNLKQVLGKTKSKRSILTNELNSTEKKIHYITVQLDAIKQNIGSNKKQIVGVESQIDDLSGQLTKQRDLLAKQLTANYQLGRHEYLMLLLNQQDLGKLNRLLAYYEYVNRERSDNIKSINTTQVAIAQQKQKLNTQLKHLQALEQEELHRQDELKGNQLYRKNVIETLNKTIQKKASQLSNFVEDKQRLERLIKKLEKDALNKKAAKSLSFSKMRHKLPWPTRGKLINSYGRPIARSKLSYNGITIRAPQGRQIQAVHGGKVVFADWMKGFGLLMIIDHGYGYMTLYAHNYNLYKKQGNFVNTGDLIASVGRSGGERKNGLYFEVRRKGKPNNPLEWLRRKQG